MSDHLSLSPSSTLSSQSNGLTSLILRLLRCKTGRPTDPNLKGCEEETVGHKADSKDQFLFSKSLSTQHQTEQNARTVRLLHLPNTLVDFAPSHADSHLRLFKRLHRAREILRVVSHRLPTTAGLPGGSPLLLSAAQPRTRETLFFNASVKCSFCASYGSQIYPLPSQP